MKKIIRIAIILMMSGFLKPATAQTDTARIQTSAICEQCKDRIENDLSFEKGIKSSSLDLKTKIVTVVYNPTKTDVQKIREAITKIGYDADTLTTDPMSYRKLPACCRHDAKQHQ